MGKVYIPATNPEDWRQLLADHKKQWKKECSARTLANCWQEADGIPAEVKSVLSQEPIFKNIESIFVFPEYKVSLKGGEAASQNDVWVLAEANSELVSIAVEGKVSEPFGDIIEKWYSKPSDGKVERLEFLCNTLGIKFPPPKDLRYQLFHRTASAIIQAKKFKAKYAIMLVHSFSEHNKWFEDYQRFLALFNVKGAVNQIVSINRDDTPDLYFAWVHGSEKYLKL